MEASRRASSVKDEREAFLRARLWRAPRSHLLDFVQLLSATREPANTYRLWRAVDIIMDGRCSTDSFHYFQMWLVGLGRDAYEAAIADPDSLAAVPEVGRLAALRRPLPDDEYPEWESLEYRACKIGDQRAGHRRRHARRGYRRARRPAPYGSEPRRCRVSQTRLRRGVTAVPPLVGSLRRALERQLATPRDRPCGWRFVRSSGACRASVS
jgi:hypothetical protein